MTLSPLKTVFLTFDVPTFPSAIYIKYENVCMPLHSKDVLLPKIWTHTAMMHIQSPLWCLRQDWVQRSTMFKATPLHKLFWAPCLQQQNLSSWMKRPSKNVEWRKVLISLRPAWKRFMDSKCKNFSQSYESILSTCEELLLGNIPWGCRALGEAVYAGPLFKI